MKVETIGIALHVQQVCFLVCLYMRVSAVRVFTRTVRISGLTCAVLPAHVRV